MGNRVVNGPLGAKLDGDGTSTKEFALGTTAIIQSSGDGGTSFNRVAVYVQALDILSTSAVVAIDANGKASASAGGYIALGSANVSQNVWVRSSAVIA